MEPLIEIERLSKRFGAITAVDGVSFSVERGEVLGFLGPNGAGKSTTMKLVTGYLQPSSGSARVCGFDVVTQPLEVKRRVGYLPEGAPLYGDMTPIRFLEFVARIRRLDGAERGRAIGAVVERLQLHDVLRQPIDTLSKGFKRRVGLAQAILLDPDVLILDEPTDGLDPNQKHEVRALLREMAGRKAVVVSTHILEEVEAVCSRAVVIAAGRVVADAHPVELAARSSRHNAVTIRVAQADAERTEPVLQSVPGVEAVERETVDGGECLLRAKADAGSDIRDRIRGVLAETGIVALEIHQERGRLDDVFRALTAPANARDDASGEPA